MLQKIDKKKHIFFYLIIFLILSSIHNSNFKYKNFFVIKKIEIVGLDKSKNLLLEKKFTDLIGHNIFSLTKESFEFINSINSIKDYNVKKIYPNQVKVYLESAKAISVIKYLNESAILGNNGKIIDLENLPTNIPNVTGTKDIQQVFQTLKLIDKSNLNIGTIKKIEFFPSERIDIEFKNKKKIKFPINLTIEKLNFSLKIMDNEEFNRTNILDLRIPNKVITYD